MATVSQEQWSLGPEWLVTRDGLNSLPEHMRGKKWEFAGKRDDGAEIYAVWPPVGSLISVSREVLSDAQKAAETSGYHLDIIEERHLGLIYTVRLCRLVEAG